ncbi:MAG: hypothetical protein QOG64_2631 [Acidimicrobiaceae bacterium]|nr:hypothetical protein [Acidimicrobiaceae bacterium]
MHGERGQILPLMAAIVVVCGLAALGLGRLGGRAVERARAQAAADAGALAGAVGGSGEASRAVEANGGRVVEYRSDGSRVSIRVEVGGATARATARGGPGGRGGDGGGGAGGGGGGGGTQSVAPALRAVLARAAALQGSPVPVVRVLEPGLSAEVDPAGVTRLLAVAESAGLCRPDPAPAPARFAICPPPPSALAGMPDGG